MFRSRPAFTAVRRDSLTYQKSNSTFIAACRVSQYSASRLAMLQAHSLLWNYLWIAPNLLLLVVAYLIWKRGFARQVPAFLAFAIIGSLGDLVVFAADIAPFVSAPNYWRISWAFLLPVALLKFLVIGEVLSKLLVPYTSVSRLGRSLLIGFGAFLVLLAGVVAGFANGDNHMRLISGFHLLEQTVFVVELGLIVFVFLFAAYFHLSWDRLSFGILLGLGISACQHLATWAVIANASPSEHTRILLALIDMGTYHLCVLIWLYYVLVPQRMVTKSLVPLPEDKLHYTLMTYKGRRLMMNSTVKTVLFWLLIGVSALLLWEVVKNARDGQKDQEVSVTQFMSDVDQNDIREIEVYGMEVRGKHRDRTQFHTTAPTNYFTPELLKSLHDKSVQIKFRDINSGNLPLTLLGTWAPLILLGALWFFMIRQSQMQVGGYKSRVRLLSIRQQFKHEVSFTQFMKDVDQNNIHEIEVADAGGAALMAVGGRHRDATLFHTTAPTNYFTPEMLKNLHDRGVLINFRQ